MNDEETKIWNLFLEALSTNTLVEELRDTFKNNYECYSPHFGQLLVRCKNNYGASIITYGHGVEKGLYEIALIQWEKDSKIEEHNYYIVYDNPILADDTVGNLTLEEVKEYLEKFSNLSEEK